MNANSFSTGRRIETTADIAAGLAHLCAADTRLRVIAEKAGELPLRRDAPGFAGLARIIVAQMVSRASAEAIWRRLAECAGTVSPAACVALTDRQCREIGLSRAKESALRAVAEAEKRDALDLEGLCLLPSEEALRHLTAVRGVGTWTAEVYLLFCAGHCDIFPAGDVALRSALAHAFGLAARPSKREVAMLAETWAPWRGVAARLFWAYYSKEMRRSVLPLAEMPA